MAQDDPADTAGPSSPPPPLPEGWLPQWEGVQRKWYYVQRATGKSQWEIPTEPVVLTPSTTPTSIGTGPSQPPHSRPAAKHSPLARGAGTTFGEGNHVVVDRAGISSSLGSEAHGQQESSVCEYTGVRDWLSSQSGQHSGSSHRQHAISGASHREPLSHAQLNHIHSPAFYQGQPHLHGQSIGGHGLYAQPWTSRTGAEMLHQGEFAGDKIQQSHQGHLAPVLSQSHPWVATLPGASASTGNENAVPQSSWLFDQQSQFPQRRQGQSDISQSNPSQPFSGYHIAPHDARHGSQHVPPPSSNRPIVHPDSEVKRQESQPVPGSIQSHSSLDMAGQAQPWQSHPLSRSYSEQTALTQHVPFPSNKTGLPFSHENPMQPNWQRYPQASGMDHLPPRADTSGHTYYGDQSQQGNSGYYQNPLVEASVNQYLAPRNQANSTESSRVHPEPVQYQTPHDTSGQHLNRPGAWVNNVEPLRAAPEDSQFVSGPWTSSPSSFGADKPFRHS